MKIKSVSLINFRNYQRCQIQLSDGINVLLGENAQGKTNLLESLSFMSSLRSFRINVESQLIQFDKDYCKLQCEVEKEITKKALSIVINKDGKSLMINDSFVKKSSDFIGELNTVLFEPNDLYFFEDAPKVRRRFMDLELTKLSQIYCNYVNQYTKVLRQRNLYLKQPDLDLEMLEVLDQQLSRCHVEIVLKRKEFINFLNEKINQKFNQLSKTQAKIELIYKTDLFFEDKDEFYQQCLEKMKGNRQRDCYFKISHFGCHRDDLISLFNGVELSQVASQGQKRLVLLALKLALIDYIYYILKEQPVLLLDDVFSELDQGHQRNFLKCCPPNIQTVITTTSLVSLPSLSKNLTLFHVKEGTIFKEDTNGRIK